MAVNEYFWVLVIVESMLALVLNAIMYRIYKELNKEGFNVTWLYGGIFDLVLIFRLYLEKRRLEYILWLLLLLVFTTCFLLVFITIIKS